MVCMMVEQGTRKLKNINNKINVCYYFVNKLNEVITITRTSKNLIILENTIDSLFMMLCFLCDFLCGIKIADDVLIALQILNMFFFIFFYESTHIGYLSVLIISGQRY